MGFDTTQLLGPLGGALAVAFGGGCAAGYTFCIRTVYKLLGDGHAKLHNSCLERVEILEREKHDLAERVRLLEERLYYGHARQLEQVRESTVRVLGADKIGGQTDGL